MANISYFVAGGWQSSDNSSFFNFPQQVQFAEVRRGGFAQLKSGGPLAYVPGNWVLAFMNSFSTTLNTPPVPPSISDANANTWTAQRVYAAGSSGISSWSAIANSATTADVINFVSGSWAATSIFAVVEVSATAGAFTVTFGTSTGSTISVTTPGGYTLTLNCTGSDSVGGPSQLIVFEWGGGVAGQTYRIAYLAGQFGDTNPLPNGWTSVGDAWFPQAGQTGATNFTQFYEFSDVQCVLSVNPGALGFQATVGGSNPPNQNVAVSSNIGAQPFTFTANQPWIIPQSGSGTTPQNVTIGINIAGLTAGHYTGLVTFGSGCGSPTVAIFLTVSTPCVVTDGGGNILSTFIPDLGLNVAPATSLYQEIIPNSQVTVSESGVEGRDAVVLDFNSGDGVYARDFETIFSWSITNRLILDVWQPSIIPMPENVYNRPADWDDGGHSGAKFIQGIIIEADSLNAQKTFSLQSADDLSVHPLLETPAIFNKQSVKAFSCVPFVSHSVRVVATDGVAWRVWSSKLVFEPFPEQTLNWQTEMTSLGFQGWGHVREMNIAHLSTADLNLVLTFDAWPTILLTIPNSGGLQAKTKVTLPANKFKLISLRIFSTAAFYLFAGDIELKAKQWGSDNAYTILRPFGGPSQTGALV